MPRLDPKTWETIRQKHEAGASFNALSKEYGVSRSAIYERAVREGWHRALTNNNLLFSVNTDLSNFVRNNLSKTIDRSGHMRLIRIREVQHLTGMGRSSVYRLIAEGRFPAPRKIGNKTSVWCLDEIERWAKNLPVSNLKKKG